MSLLQKHAKQIIILCLTITILVIINSLKINWALSTTIIFLAVFSLLLINFEKKSISLNYLAMIATVSSFAAVGRIIFTGIMSIQPTTFIVMIVGYTWGSKSGLLVGMLGGLVSNFYLGQGPWTPWQMLGWGVCGLLAGLLGRFNENLEIIQFTILAGICGFVFGALMNIWHWLAFTYPLSWTGLVAVFAASFPFDIIHAVNNVIFAVVLSRPFYQVLNRFRRFL